MSAGPRWLPKAIFYNLVVVGAVQALVGLGELGYAALGSPDKRAESFAFGVGSLGPGVAALTIAAGMRALDRSG